MSGTSGAAPADSAFSTTVSSFPARPAPGPPRPYHFPVFERVTLDNGLGVIVAPVRKLPLVTVSLVVPGGAGVERPGREGVANLAALGLLEGTTRRDGNEMAERLEGMGAALGAAADWDSTVVTLTVLSARLREAMALYGEVLREPAFPEREVERLKAERLAEILQLRTEPRGLADEMFARFVYDASERYANPEDGSTESVQALMRADLVGHYAERFRPGGATLVMVGDLSVDEGVGLARELSAAWSGTAAALPVPGSTPANAIRTVHLVQKPAAPQSELRIGHVGLPRSHPDYFPVSVMNAVLGGLFSSRINLNLREAHAYTYGAFSGFGWRIGAGPFVASTAVRSDVTAAAAREVLNEIDRMRADGITEDERSLAVSYLDGVFPIKYETTDAIARALAAMVVYGLPSRYFDRYREWMRAVTREDVLRVAREHLHPDALQLVAVGDPAVIRAPLEELNVGPVLEYDAEGQRVTG